MYCDTHDSVNEQKRIVIYAKKDIPVSKAFLPPAAPHTLYFLDYIPMSPESEFAANIHATERTCDRILASTPSHNHVLSRTSALAPSTPCPLAHTPTLLHPPSTTRSGKSWLTTTSFRSRRWKYRVIAAPKTVAKRWIERSTVADLSAQKMIVLRLEPCLGNSFHNHNFSWFLFVKLHVLQRIRISRPKDSTFKNV